MRGNEAARANLFSYVHVKDHIPRWYPLRPVRPVPRTVGEALIGLDGAFASTYATTGGPSIP